MPRPKKPGRRPKDRHPSQTTITLSIPKTLKAEVQKAAARDHRTASSWAARVFEAVVKMERRRQEQIKKGEVEEEISPKAFANAIFGAGAASTEEE